jgi:hypothetical protein
MQHVYQTVHFIGVLVHKIQSVFDSIRFQSINSWKSAEILVNFLPLISLKYKHDITAIQFTVFIRIQIKHGVHHNLFFLALSETDFR